MILSQLILLLPFTVVTAAYIFVVLYLSVRLQPTFRPANGHGKPHVLVVVAFRNEKENIPSLISSLDKQTYPQAHFILIDDHSTDESLELTRNLTKNSNRFQLLTQVNGKAGKKAALELATQNTVAEYIIFTDADCRFSPHWVEQLVTAMVNDNLDLCSAPVFIDNPKTMVEKLQATEMAFLTGIGLALIACGKPVFCSGANLAIANSLSNIPLKNNIASGDDIFRLQYAVSCGKRIGNILNPECTVFTKAEKTFSGWINQRIRWAGKSTYYTDPFAIGFTVFTGVSQLVAILSIVLLQPQVWILLWGLKILAEVIFITRVMKMYKLKFSFLSIVTLGIMYPFFSVGIAMLSAFVRPRWKGRKI